MRTSRIRVLVAGAGIATDVFGGEVRKGRQGVGMRGVWLGHGLGRAGERGSVDGETLSTGWAAVGAR
ncbi:hypothetical protein GCM10010149_83430 [Nonomuraea roseoviolacea subsp. roseoviolacea]